MTSSASNRSFRLPRRVLSNRQNQSFPPLSDEGKLLEKSSGARTKLPQRSSPSQSSQQKTTSSSFWAEWAAEMQANEENVGTDVPYQISLGKEDQQCTTSPTEMFPPSSNGNEATNHESDLRSPLMASQLVINSSMSSVSVMNLSVGPLRASPRDNNYIDRDLDQLHDAMTDNMAAQHLLESEKYQESLIIYRKAMRQFVKICDHGNRVIAGVNAASCYRNMSTAARMLKRYDEATKCLALAVAWYLKSHALVMKETQKSIVTLDGKMIDNSMVSPNKSVTSLTDTACIDIMLIEALHYQANFCLEHKGDLAGAFAAHDSVLAHLVELDKLDQWKEASTTLCCLDGVVFTTATQNQQISWLVESLGTLGEFFLVHKQFSDTPLALFEKGIDILQNRFEESGIKGEGIIHDLSFVLRQLSEIYFSRQLHDLAADALHDSASIRLRSAGKPSDDALCIMEKVAAANERARCYDQARSCYEQIMMARSKYYGTTDLFVAKALFDIGRSIEKKSGPTEESDEILKTAKSILALHLTEGVPDLRKNMDLIMQLLPSMQHFDRSASVVSDLDKSLSELHLQPNSPYEGPFDKAQIFFDLGRSFMRLEKDSLASTCFRQAMQETKCHGSNRQEEILVENGQVTDEKEPSILLAGEEIDLNETQDCTVSFIGKVPGQAKPSPTKPLPTKEYVSEIVCSNQEPSVLLETEPSMYFFEDAPSEISYHQPTKRDECWPTILKETALSQPASYSLKVKSVNPINRKPVSATLFEKTHQCNTAWRQLFCPVWSTSATFRNGSPMNASRESLKSITCRQQQISQVKPRPSTRSKIVSKLCTIHESLSFGHEKEEPEASHLLHRSDSSFRTSSGNRRNPQRAVSYTTMRRKQYAAV